MPKRVIRRRAASSFGPVLSFENIGLDVETIIGNEGLLTSVLIREARTIADSTVDVVLHSYQNRTVYVGVLLHALLDYAGKNVIPGRVGITGERYTAGVIYAAYRSEKVGEVALIWLESMIRPMKTAGSARPVEPSEEQTPREELEQVEVTIEAASRSRQKNLRNEVCIRQDYGCILHRQEIARNAPREAQNIPGRYLFGLGLAHIIPFALNDFALDDKGTIHPSAVTWTMIQNWTSVSIRQLMGDGINDPTNAILICLNGHDLFSRFELVFEPTDIEHCYVTRSLVPPYDNIHVDFRSNSTIPPPNPLYFAIHAAFAGVLRASGAAEYIDMCLQDQEEIAVLASDGSTDISTLLSGFHTIQVR